MKHKNNKFIAYNHTLDEYYKKYRNRRDKLLKYSKSEVAKASNDKDLTKNSLLKRRRWWFINDTYYEIPIPPRITWFRNLRTSTQIVTSVILGGLVISSIGIPTYILIKNISNTDINVNSEGDTYILLNKIVLKKQPNGDYVGSLVFKDNMIFDFIESISINIDNSVILSKDKDYKLDKNKSDLTIYAHNNINKNNKVTVYIKRVTPSIKLNKKELRLYPGNEETLVATVKGILGTVKWYSDDSKTATVDDYGKVTAIAVGETEITASIGDIKDTCTVTVSS